MSELTSEDCDYLRKMLRARKRHLAEVYIGVYAEAGKAEIGKINATQRSSRPASTWRG